MRIFFTADIHWIGDWKTPSIDSLTRQWRQAKADMLVVAGDLSISSEAKKTCKQLRRMAGDKPIAIVLGNHDYWCGRRFLQRRNVLLWSVEHHFWYVPMNEHHITLLQDRKLVISGTHEVVGVYGGYDFSFAVPGLTINGEEVTNEDYERGRHPSFAPDVQLNDIKYMPKTLGIDWECLEQARRLNHHLHNSFRRFIVVLHTLPFPELNDEVASDDISKFFMAYSGSKRLGDVIRMHSHRIDLVVCGHRGGRVVKEVAGVKCVNIGSEYGKPRHIIYNTETKEITEDYSSGEKQ